MLDEPITWGDLLSALGGVCVAVVVFLVVLAVTARVKGWWVD